MNYASMQTEGMTELADIFSLILPADLWRPRSDADKRFPNGHNLRQVLQGRVERFLGQEQDQVDGILRVGDYSEEVSSAAREIIQLVQLNLQLAAKLAVLQALS
eukprot:gene1811-1978_t